METKEEETERASAASWRKQDAPRRERKRTADHSDTGMGFET